MTRLIARLILAMLTLPVGGTVLVLSMVVVLSATPPNGPPPALGFTAAWLAVYAATGTWWTLVWQELVQWNARRVALTAFAALAALCGGVALGLLVRVASGGMAPPGIAIAIGGGLPPVIWVAATVFIWRETAEERTRRLASIGGAGICCPLCGYPMATLHTSNCPECGARFTVEQLLNSQRQRDASTLHDVDAPATPKG
jgi:hypothetical protein